MKLAQVGILFDKSYAERHWRYGLNTFEAYIGEILAHAGIPFVWLNAPAELETSGCDIVIVACAEETARTAELLWRYAEGGGRVVSYGGLDCLARKLGYRAAPERAPGYAELPAWADGAVPPLRWLQAKPWREAWGREAADDGGFAPATGFGTLHRGRPGGEPAGAALQRFAVGSGSIDRWAVDIASTVVGLQQGTKPVLADGIPAGDGTAPLDEGTLKADDCIELDWELDRLETETGKRYFAYPYADYWREAAVGHLLRLAVGAGLTLPVVDYWPEGVEAVAMFSHDSDINLDEHAERTLEVLAECGIQTTWCMLEPGYDPSYYVRIKEAGHELAFHYDALAEDDRIWDEAEFNRQLAWLKEAADIDSVASNKNHYTRIDGWGDLFAWCERSGIGIDQTRGPSKKGNVGFLFGTCHPYFPIAWADEGNRLYNVLEIGFLTQDIDHWGLADFSVVAPFLEQVRRVGGFAHFLSHQNQIHGQPAVAAAVGRIVAEARRRGFVFWTSERIGNWERARRTVSFAGSGEGGELRFAGAPEAGGAVVWMPVGEAEAERAAGRRFGLPCAKYIVSN
ncbi:MAG: hypothetical protein J7639_01340 [Paenibacillaceae bacterium]|nr:hypothetical protein [Paenibacillaceae bacterium]